MIIRVGHLYPEYLNIYADRGNIAVFVRRAAARGPRAPGRPVTLGTPLAPRAHDLLYVGGGQDREQAMIAPDLAARRDAIRRAVEGGTALLAVCGGYQLLGRGYRGRDGSWLGGRGLFPHETLAGETRMIGDVLLESALAGGRGGRSPASRTTRAGRCWTSAPSRSAASSQATATTARPASRDVGSAVRSGRTSTGRSSRATRGSPTCSSPGRSPTRPATSPSRSPRSPTSSRPRRTPSPPIALAARGGRAGLSGYSAQRAPR